MHPLHGQERYEEGYGTVLDSGTTFTYLPTDAFQSFKEAVTAFALEHGLKSVKGPDPKVSACCPLQGSTQARQDERPALWVTFMETSEGRGPTPHARWPCACKGCCMCSERLG